MSGLKDSGDIWGLEVDSGALLLELCNEGIHGTGLCSGAEAMTGYIRLQCQSQNNGEV